jgi:hypothetical protein
MEFERNYLQDRPPALASAVYRALTLPSGAWSSSSCAFRFPKKKFLFVSHMPTFEFFFCWQGFLFYPCSCLVEYRHRLGQEGFSHAVWNAARCHSLGCLVSGHYLWFVCVPLSLRSERCSSIVFQVNSPVFATHSYLDTVVHSVHLPPPIMYRCLSISLLYILTSNFNPGGSQSVFLSSFTLTCCEAIYEELPLY